MSGLFAHSRGRPDAFYLISQPLPLRLQINGLQREKSKNSLIALPPLGFSRIIAKFEA